VAGVITHRRAETSRKFWEKNGKKGKAVRNRCEITSRTQLDKTGEYLSTNTKGETRKTHGGKITSYAESPIISFGGVTVGWLQNRWYGWGR